MQNYFRGRSGKIFAHGRDPNFDGWTDTVQLNYLSAGTSRCAYTCDLVCSTFCRVVAFLLPLVARERAHAVVFGKVVATLGVSHLSRCLPETMSCSELRAEIGRILHCIADRADGVRCDMAMLACSSVLHRTWGERFKSAEGRLPSITAIHYTKFRVRPSSSIELIST